MFIRVYNVTYVETQINLSKPLNFIISRKMVKSTIKLYRRLFLHKINKNMQRNSGGNVLYIREYGVRWIENFLTL